MSRYYINNKNIVEDCLKLSIFNLKKWNYLKTSYSGWFKWTRVSGHENKISFNTFPTGEYPYLRLFYTATNRYTQEKTDYDYNVSLTTTPCNFGGNRYWFVCPLSKKGLPCNRRVGVIYLPPNEGVFGCRHCYELSYNVRNLGGISKTVGQIVSWPEFEKRESAIKRKYYAGKMTKKYKRLLEQKAKSDWQVAVMSNYLDSK